MTSREDLIRDWQNKSAQAADEWTCLDELGGSPIQIEVLKQRASVYATCALELAALGDSSMSIDSIEAREKQRRDRYREAARRLYPTVKISPHADVHEDAEKSGAFLPASVWVPADALDKE